MCIGVTFFHLSAIGVPQKKGVGAALILTIAGNHLVDAPDIYIQAESFIFLEMFIELGFYPISSNVNILLPVV